MEKEVLVNLEKCLGCRSCEVACVISHSSDKTLPTAIGEKPQKRLFVEQAGKIKAPVTCRHCEEAYCVSACIAGSMRKLPDGTVTNAETGHKCTGCWMCVMVCPNGVIRRARTAKKAVKCDRKCVDDQGIPACVAACPTKALVFMSVDEFNAGKRTKQLADIQQDKT